MTCFWDALRSKLNIKDSNEIFIINLKSKNNKNKNILWNNTSLSDKQLEENYMHVREFDEKKINNGYDCSICDPFLILISTIYNVSINHNFNGVIINYKNNAESEKILNFQSNNNHFW